jgi:diguanylate cyclase (GGDEF)-like protein
MMKKPLHSGDLVTAEQTVRLLDQQTASLRADLERLRRTLRGLDGDLTRSRATELLEADEQLTRAARHADVIAETAVNKLDELARTSQLDVLTGTPNRSLMLDRINAAILYARRHRHQCAVMFLDLDDFKRINDTFGHDAGDEVIVLVATRLQAGVRESDSVGRHGGDEFVVLLAELQQQSDAAVVATKLLASLRQPCTIEGHALTFSASLGIAVWPGDGEDAATLINRADAAMYHSKRNGNGAFEFHSSTVATTRTNRILDSATLRELARAVPDEAPRLQDLHDANEQLVLEALTARERELKSHDVHQEQIRFVAMVAHELRSPLAPLGTAAELLKHAVRDEHLLMKLQAIIKRQVAHMARLVDDLLDGSRATTGKLRLERARVDAAAVLAQAVEAIQPLMVARRQNFRVEIEAGPLIVTGDVVRLAQVFSNLLDNASKYTPIAGHIGLSASVHEQQLRVVISDDGIGISAAALPRIFDLFVQEEHAIDVNKGGLGIGLAVVRDLVAAHGGSVSCASPGRGLGSEFTVTLPLEAAG